MDVAFTAACAAPGARSWVGWVRVAGAAGVIDALVAWQEPSNFGCWIGRDSAAAPSFLGVASFPDAPFRWATIRSLPGCRPCSRTQVRSLRLLARRLRL